MKYLIVPDEIKHLDGFDAHNERTVIGVVPTTYMVGNTSVVGTAAVANTVTDRPFRLIHPSGRQIDFNSSVKLGFRTKTSPGEPTQWRKISIVDDRLRAESLRPGTATVDLPWSDVQGGVVQETSYGRGLAFAGGAVAAAGLMVMIAGLASPTTSSSGRPGIHPATTIGGATLGVGVLWFAGSALFGWNLDADE